MNVTCSAEPCPVILNATCVFYEGNTLVYTGIVTNDNLETALQKIDQKFQDSNIGYIFTNGLEQLAPGQPVMLGGALVKNTTIGGLYNLAFAGTLEASALITTGGTSTDFVKGDGSLDPTSYQPSGNYITDLTGDVLANGPGSVTATLATVFGAPGTYGNSGNVPAITVDGKGRITNVTPIPINYPAQSLSFIGDVEGLGFTGSPVTLTLDTVNTDVYGSNNFLKFAVNGKGLITSATPVSDGDITTALGYVPVNDAIELTINGVAHDLTANRSWNVGTVTGVSITAGTGLNASIINPNTTPSISIVNTAPDQTVVLNSGFGISVTGSYPNFTVTNDYPSLGGTVTNFSAGNLSPLFTTSVANSSTTPALSFALSSAAANTVLAGPNGGAGAPSYRALVAADLPSLAYISSISTTAPLATTGGLTPTLSISQSNSTTDGYLSSTDWNTFNNKQNALGYTPVPDTRQLSINGVGYDLTADRCWSVGTVTSITASAPLTGGTITGSGSVGITQAGAGSDGYLSSADWNTFNSKQVAGNYITDLTGDATASGPGSACLTLATVNASTGTFGSSTQVPVITVNNKGLVTCVTTDTISGSLEFIGDVTGVGSTGTCTTLTLATVNNDVYTSETLLNIAVNGKGLITSANPTTSGDICSTLGYTPENVANKSTSTSLGTSNTLYPTQLAVKTYVDSATAGGIILQGNWDASTNTPNISGTTTTGWAWRVDVAGTTNLGGITDWQVGDLAVKSATGWVKIDNTENVTSVFGRFGAIVATTGDYLSCQVTECGNLYYTDARVRAAVGHTAPLTYNSTTGVFGITQSNTTTDGYLSATDWNTFNDKQPLIVAGTTSQYYRGDKTFQTLDTSVVTEGTNLYFTDARARAAICAGAGISYNSTSGEITNSCPDQIVSLTGGGTTSITGTYPNFTITSSDCFSGTVTCVAVSGTNIGVTGSPITSAGTIGLSLSGANVCSALGYTPYNATNPAGYTTCVGTVTSVATCTSTTGVLLSGSPITSSGTLGIDISTASTSCTGLLTAADWNTFNSHTGCTGTVTSVGLTSSTTGVTIGSSPVTTSGNITLNIATASATCTGLLTAADFNNFNSHTSCTGTVTCVAATGTNINVTGSPITTSGTLAISLSGANVCSALGYTPYNATNPNGYTTCVGTVTSVGIVATNINVCASPVTTTGNICLNLTGANVCAALGYSPAPTSSVIMVPGSGTGSTIRCGVSNTASGTYSAALGGCGNIVSGTASSILGGRGNGVGVACSSISGGYGNNIVATTGRSSIVGGSANCIAGSGLAFIGGGNSNTVSGSYYGTIAGGVSNTVSTWAAFIGAGVSNSVSGGCAAVLGGFGNSASGGSSAVGGGRSNTASNTYATVGGGLSNIASGSDSVVSGGRSNCATNNYSTVGGGQSNTASAAFAFVGGGCGNVSSGTNSFTGGGRINDATGNYSFVGGGDNQTASGAYSVAVGGNDNIASGIMSSILGGRANLAQGNCSFVGGGQSNTVTTQWSTIGGGNSNSISGNRGFIGGGQSNTVSASYFGTVSGGVSNTASSYASTVGGGQGNGATGTRSFVGGGHSNTASGACSTIGGGNGNSAGGPWSSIGGGLSNGANFNYATVAGGIGNTTCSNYGAISGGYYNCTGYVGFVGGGDGNKAMGAYAAIAGGYCNCASGACSFIGGGGAIGVGGNIASGAWAVIGGGCANTACGTFATITGGQGNFAPGVRSFIGGGFSNTASSTYATVAGGQSNQATGIRNFVGGGQGNRACGSYFATVSGGYGNSASGYASTINGGISNTASGCLAFVGGGCLNTVSGGYGSALLGGCANIASGTRSTVGAGMCNRACGASSFVGGGEFNVASGTFSTTAGGFINTASGTYSIVSGGQANGASGAWSAIGGGSCNTATVNRASVGGGHANSASGNYARVGGGFINNASGYMSVIGGGCQNGAGSNVAFVGGGQSNAASGACSAIAGGQGNGASGAWSIVAGGQGNSASGTHSFVGGGVGNAASGVRSTVGGGWGNTASAYVGTVGGGCNNRATFYWSTVGGGLNNLSSGDASVIAGGVNNTSSAYHSTVGGGNNNTANFRHAFVGGGLSNIASNCASSVGGGQSNTASGCMSTIAGGQGNLASVTFATVSGGYYNTAEQYGSTVGGGLYNNIYDAYATIGGGYDNTINGGGYMSTIAGGRINIINNQYVAIGGGCQNCATGCVSTIGGGYLNYASGPWSTVGGGDGNTASGYFSFVGGGKNNCTNNSNATISGGRNNSASGYSSFVGGGSNNNLGCSTFGIIVGGSGNSNSSYGGIIVGGSCNSNNSFRSFLGGGSSNSMSGGYNSFIGGGISNCSNFSSLSSIIGGRDNCNSYGCNTHIIGSCIAGYATNYTYVNNLCQTGGGISDRRTKNTICDTGYRLCDIVKLRPVSYCWNHDSTNSKKYGFIAQEVQEAIPDIVSYNEIEKVGPDGKRTIFGEGEPVLQFEKEAIYASYVNAFKELNEKNQALEARIAALEELIKGK